MLWQYVPMYVMLIKQFEFEFERERTHEGGNTERNTECVCESRRKLHYSGYGSDG